MTTQNGASTNRNTLQTAFADANRIIRQAEFRELTGWSRPTVYRKVRAGKAPTPIMDGKTLIGFTAGAYMEWIQNAQK